MIVLFNIFSFRAKKGGKEQFRYPIHSSCIRFKVEIVDLQKNTESCRSWDHTLQMGGKWALNILTFKAKVVMGSSWLPGLWSEHKWGLYSALFPPILSPLLPPSAPAAGANNRNIPPRKSKSPNLFSELLL